MPRSISLDSVYKFKRGDIFKNLSAKKQFCFNRNSFLFQFSKKKHLKKHVIIRTKYEWKRTLRKRCPYLELFWSVFSRIRTEYREIRSISRYSVRMRENVNQITPNTDTFHAVVHLFFRNLTRIELLGRRMDFIDIKRSFSK